MGFQESDSSYWDDPNFTPLSTKSPLTRLFRIAVLSIPLLVISNTMASNMNLVNNENVEFGQGLSQATTCDSEINFYPVSTFTNSLWTVVDGNDLQSDGFMLTDFVVSDIANTCMGKQFIINAYSDTSSSPLNSDPLRVNFLEDFGGYFTFDVDSPNTIQAFLGESVVETSTSGLGSRGSTLEKGTSSFHLGDWAGLYSNPGQVDARLVKKYTIQTQDIPRDSLAFKSGTYSVTSGNTLDGRTIWVKGLYVKSSGHADDIYPNSSQGGVSIKQPFWIYVPTDATRNVTKTAYTFTGSVNISCVDYHANGDAGWIYECTPSNVNWSLSINYSGP